MPNFLYFIEVMDMRTMDPRKIPFECEYPTVEDLRAALIAGPVAGRKIIYGQVPNDFRLLRSKIETTLDQRRDPVIEKCRFRFVEETA